MEFSEDLVNKRLLKANSKQAGGTVSGDNGFYILSEYSPAGEAGIRD